MLDVSIDYDDLLAKYANSQLQSVQRHELVERVNDLENVDREHIKQINHLERQLKKQKKELEREKKQRQKIEKNRDEILRVAVQHMPFIETLRVE